MERITEKHLKKRVRTFDLSQYVSTEGWNDPYGSNPPYVYYTGSHYQTVDTKETVGFNIPNYHQKLRSGQLLPMTPFTQTTIKGSTWGYKDQVNTTGTRIYFSDPPGYIVKNGWILTKDDLAAYIPTMNQTFVMEAAAKIYSNGWDALTFAAELKDCLRMFVNLAKYILDPSLPRKWRRYSAAWLSYRYGWRPLLYDMDSFIDALIQLKDKRSRFSERVGYTTTTGASSFTSTYTQWYYEDTTINDLIEVSQRGSVVADIDIPTFQFNPLQTAWEVIPYSFVVDWFVNVGKALSALAFCARAKSYSACSGYRIKIDRTFNSENGTPGPIYKSGGFQQIGSCIATLEHRQPCTIPYIPQIVLRLNTTKVLDLVGLITQLI